MENTTQCENIPNDILALEIFSRLPAKTLIRLTAVCKSWSSLIINADFIAAHLSRMKLSEFNKGWCLNFGFASYTILSEDEPPCGDEHEGDEDEDEDEDEDDQTELMLPSVFQCEEIIGHSCNGLFCLIMSYFGGWGIFLWNPSIRKFKTLQTFSGDNISCHISRNIVYGYGYDEQNNVVYGFGYDEQSKDHKVVRITFASTNQVDIYRLSTDSWHKVQKARVPESLQKNYTSGIYLYGAIHWLTMDLVESIEHLKSIVSFDFNDETFKDMILPSEMQVRIDLFEGINELKESIAILLADTFLGKQYYLWVMNEYGVTKSWTKIKISIPEEFSPWPLLFIKDGTILLKKSRHQLAFYGLEDHKIKYIFGNLKHVWHLVDYTESLLLADYEDDWLMYELEEI